MSNHTPFDFSKVKIGLHPHLLPSFDSSPEHKKINLQVGSPQTKYPNLKYLKTPVRVSKPLFPQTPQSWNWASLGSAGSPLYFTEKEIPSPLPSIQVTLGDLTTSPSLFTSTMASTVSLGRSPKKVLRKNYSTSNVGSPKKILRKGSSIESLPYQSARLTSKAILREIQGKTEVVEGMRTQEG